MSCCTSSTISRAPPKRSPFSSQLENTLEVQYPLCTLEMWKFRRRRRERPNESNSYSSPTAVYIFCTKTLVITNTQLVSVCVPDGDGGADVRTPRLARKERETVKLKSETSNYVVSNWRHLGLFTFLRTPVVCCVSGTSMCLLVLSLPTSLHFARKLWETKTMWKFDGIHWFRNVFNPFQMHHTPKVQNTNPQDHVMKNPYKFKSHLHYYQLHTNHHIVSVMETLNALELQDLLSLRNNNMLRCTAHKSYL